MKDRNTSLNNMSAATSARAFSSTQSETFSMLYPQKVQERPTAARQASFPPIFAAYASMPPIETPRRSRPVESSRSAPTSSLSLFQHSKRANLLDDLTTIFAGVPISKAFVMRASLPVARKAAEKKKRTISAPVASSFVHVQSSAHLAPTTAKPATTDEAPISPASTESSFYGLEPAFVDFRCQTPPLSTREMSLPPSPALSPKHMPAPRPRAVLKKPRTHSMEARAMTGWMSTLVDDYAETDINEEAQLGQDGCAWVTAAELEWRDALSSAEESASRRSGDRWNGNWV